MGKLYDWFCDLEPEEAPDWLVDLSCWWEEQRCRRMESHRQRHSPAAKCAPSQKNAVLSFVLYVVFLSCAVGAVYVFNPFKTKNAKTPKEQEQKVIQGRDTVDNNITYIRFYGNTHTR